MPQVEDNEGKPGTVSNRELFDQQSAESREGWRKPWQDFVASGVTPVSLGLMLRSAANWDSDRLMKFAEEVEERDGHYKSVLGTRKMAVRQLPWSIQPASEDKADEEIAEFVREAIDRKGFNACLGDLLDGLSKGFSVVEIVWKPEAHEGAWRLVPNQYLYRNQRHFGFDEETQTRVQLKTAKATQYGEPLQPAKYITHMPRLKSGKIIRSGLIFTAAALYLMKAFVTKDWMAFSEVFGMPLVYAKMLESATDDEKEKIFNGLMALGSDSKALFSGNVELEFLGINNTQHGNFYIDTVGFFNKETSKVVLGQTMTSEDGASLSQAKVHEGVRNDIRNSDALTLAETLNDQLIRPLVELNFGPGTRPPTLVFDVSEPEDMVAFAEAIVPFIGLGLQVRSADIYSRFGLEKPDDGDDVLTAKEVSAMAGLGMGDGIAADGVDEDPPETDDDRDDVPDGEDAMSALQASRALGVPVTQVFALEGAGELTAYRGQDGRRRYLASDVQKTEARASAPFAGTAIE
jgi:phage gp29-like protein